MGAVAREPHPAAALEIGVGAEGCETVIWAAKKPPCWKLSVRGFQGAMVLVGELGREGRH